MNELLNPDDETSEFAHIESVETEDQWLESAYEERTECE